MRKRRVQRWPFWLGCLALALTGGCSGLGGGGPVTGPGALPAGLAPEGILPASHVEESPQEQISVLVQKLSANEDDRKALLGRLQRVEAQLEEKEKALVLAGTEIAAATQEVARTRQELQRWQQELTELRDRLRKVEKEDRDALGAAVRTLEQMLERAPGAGQRKEP